MGLTPPTLPSSHNCGRAISPKARRLLALLTPVLERLPLTTYLFNGGVDRGDRGMGIAPSTMRHAIAALSHGLEADIAGTRTVRTPSRLRAWPPCAVTWLRRPPVSHIARRAAEEAGQRRCAPSSITMRRLRSQSANRATPPVPVRCSTVPWRSFGTAYAAGERRVCPTSA